MPVLVVNGSVVAVSVPVRNAQVLCVRRCSGWPLGKWVLGTCLRSAHPSIIGFVGNLLVTLLLAAGSLGIV